MLMFEKFLGSRRSTKHIDVATYQHRPILEPASKETSLFNNFSTSGERLKKRWEPGKFYFVEQIMTKVRSLFRPKEDYLPKAQREAKENSLNR